LCLGHLRTMMSQIVIEIIKVTVSDVRADTFAVLMLAQLKDHCLLASIDRSIHPSNAITPIHQVLSRPTEM